jgi:hypothetical protein
MYPQLSRVICDGEQPERRDCGLGFDEDSVISKHHVMSSPNEQRDLILYASTILVQNSRI